LIVEFSPFLHEVCSIAYCHEEHLDNTQALDKLLNVC